MKKKIFNFFIFISLENISISRCSLIFQKDKYATDKAEINNIYIVLLVISHTW